MWICVLLADVLLSLWLLCILLLLLCFGAHDIEWMIRLHQKSLLAVAAADNFINFIFSGVIAAVRH